MKILLLFAHPALNKSRVNKSIIEGLQGMQDLTFHDLYEAYPDSYIDIEYEQKLVEDHDIIIFQFPMYWYSTPAILKEWQDMVLQHGWAYGSEGNALKDKLFLCSITAGSPRSAYRIGDFHNHTFNQLIAPLKQTAILCGMIPLPPFVIFATHILNPEEIQDNVLDLISLLKRIRSGDLQPHELSDLEFLNDLITTH